MTTARQGLEQDRGRWTAFASLRQATAVLLGAFVLCACAPERASPADYHGDPSVRGSVAKVEPIGDYSVLRMRFLLALVKINARVSGGVHLYRISYWSTTDGRPVLVSALMSVPDKGPLRGTVLWMHGTHDSRADSVSNPSSEEAQAASDVFAGGGYLLLAPDLLGLGVSKAPQAYFYNPSTTDVTLDLLRAAKTVTQDLGRTWNPNLYVTGFSQGGHSAAVIQREIEQHPNPDWRVKGAAGIAGPYEVADISFPFAMNGHSPQDSDYLATWALSYATYYHHPLDSLLAQPYADAVTRLFDGDHSLPEIAKAMPPDPRGLFTPAFLAAFDAKTPSWFEDALHENQITAWAPQAPFRAYYGDRDVDVSAADAQTFVADAKAHGGNAEAISVGPYDHGESVLKAAPLIRQWFDTLSAGAATP